MFDHLLVGEAQDGDALTAEEGVAESVTSLSRGVGRAVHLDGQFGFDAKEVGEVVADGELSTELEAVDLSARSRLQRSASAGVGRLRWQRPNTSPGAGAKPAIRLQTTNPPGLPPHESEGGWGEKRQHLPLDTEHGHYFSSLLRR